MDTATHSMTPAGLFQFMRRGFVSLLFFLLATSCTCPAPQWSSQEVPEYHVTRKTTWKNVELESLSVDIFQQDEKAYVYLNLHHLPLNDNEEEIALQIEDREIKTKGRVLCGGQKILVPERESVLMLEALNHHQPVIVSIACYTKVLEAF